MRKRSQTSFFYASILILASFWHPTNIKALIFVWYICSLIIFTKKSNFSKNGGKFPKSAKGVRRLLALLNCTKCALKTAAPEKLAKNLTKIIYFSKIISGMFIWELCVFTSKTFHCCERNASIEYAGWITCISPKKTTTKAYIVGTKVIEIGIFGVFRLSRKMMSLIMISLHWIRDKTQAHEQALNLDKRNNFLTSNELQMWSNMKVKQAKMCWLGYYPCRTRCQSRLQKVNSQNYRLKLYEIRPIFGSLVCGRYYVSAVKGLGRSVIEFSIQTRDMWHFHSGCWQWKLIQSKTMSF